MKKVVEIVVLIAGLVLEVFCLARAIKNLTRDLKRIMQKEGGEN